VFIFTFFNELKEFVFLVLCVCCACVHQQDYSKINQTILLKLDVMIKPTCEKD